MNHNLFLLACLLIGDTAQLFSAQDDAPTGRPTIRFTDVTSQAKIDFKHTNAASGEKYLIETMGPGCAFVDYDGDDYLDIYIVNGGLLPGFQSKQEPKNVLYRNNRDGTFTDVTGKAGVEGRGYGMGVTAGDYNNDGFPDLYVTNYRSSLLYRNNGDGTFTEVAESAGVNNKKWGTSGAFFDYDKDGFLDLYVANYVDFSVERNVQCSDTPGTRSYCHPREYKGLADVLYHNNGDGTFTDVTKRAGIAHFKGKGLGVVAADFNNDGYQDLYVANDLVPNFLYANNQDGTFQEIGALGGVAYNGYGLPQAGMGVAAGDYNGDGKLDVLVTNLSTEGHALYRNEGQELFTDVSFPSGIGSASLLFSGWGTDFFDFDNDGDEDIFAVSGHPMDTIELVNGTLTYLQPSLLLENREGRYVDATSRHGESLSIPRATRGAALGDMDNDGDLDILIGNCNGRPNLLRNDGGNRNHWLTIRAIGAQSNRDGIGVRIKVTAGGKTQMKEITGGGSYLSTCDLRSHFGLGKNQFAERVEVTWPSGKSQILQEVKGDRILAVREP